MKHLFATLLLSFFNLVSIAQFDTNFHHKNMHRFINQDYIYSESKKKVKVTIDPKLIKPEEKEQYQVDFVRYCLKKYHDEKMTGYFLQLGGILLVGSGLSIEKKSDEVNGIYQNETGGWTYDTTVPNYGVHKADNSLRNVLIIGGAACSLSGIVFLIDSEKWMKRAYIGPDGFGVMFTF